MSGSGPSRLIETRRMPTSTTRLATSSFMIVPLVASAVGRPMSWASWARSKRSGRINGSPPEKTTIGLPVSGRERIIDWACSGLRSSLLSCRETSSRRQWTHARLHAAVVSQNSRRSGGAWGGVVSLGCALAPIIMQPLGLRRRIVARSLGSRGVPELENRRPVDFPNQVFHAGGMALPPTFYSKRESADC
jgi:hypothetical protein